PGHKDCLSRRDRLQFRLAYRRSGHGTRRTARQERIRHLSPALRQRSRPGLNMLEVKQLGLEGVLEILPRRFSDDRGFFSETYNAEAFAAAGIDLVFVQDNHSLSTASGVLRGLHYQLPPRAQDKLVRVTKGAILDVAVDIRRHSPDFG